MTETMANQGIPSLINLPIETVCRILDHLDPLDILLSVRDTCTRLNQIIDTYQPYQVNLIDNISFMFVDTFAWGL